MIAAAPLATCQGRDLADVDGTLIRSVGDKANSLHKESFSVAFREVFGIDTHIDVLQHHGGTDPLILAKVMIEAHGKDKDEVMAKMSDMKQAMLQHYDANSSRCAILYQRYALNRAVRCRPGIAVLASAANVFKHLQIR